MLQEPGSTGSPFIAGTHAGQWLYHRGPYSSELVNKVLRASLATWKSCQNTPVLRPNKSDNPDSKSALKVKENKPSKSNLSAMHFPEARQGDFAMSVDVLIRALVHVLHQVLLKQEGVVGSHGAGVVVELLVIVADVCLPLGGEELVHIHLVTQRHHEHNAKHS